MMNLKRNEKTVGITGASGALGKELTKLFRQKGFKVIGFTHSKTNSEINLESPNTVSYTHLTLPTIYSV